MAKKPAKNETLTDLCKLILDEAGVSVSVEEAEAWLKTNRFGRGAA